MNLDLHIYKCVHIICICVRLLKTDIVTVLNMKFGIPAHGVLFMLNQRVEHKIASHVPVSGCGTNVVRIGVSDIRRAFYVPRAIHMYVYV